MEPIEGTRLSSLARQPRRKYRFSSEEARARCGTAGARNLAAYRATGAKAALVHGLSGLLKGGQPPRGTEAIQLEVGRMVDRLASEAGGLDSCTASQCSLLAAIQTALLVIALSKDLLLSRGLVTRRGTPRAVLEVLNSYLNSLCRLVAAFRGREEDQVPEDVVPSEEERQAAIRELVGGADAEDALPTWVTTPQEPGLDVDAEPETIAELIEDSVEEVADTGEETDPNKVN